MSIRMPIVERWREAFTTLKEAGRLVTVQGSAWVIRDAEVIAVENEIVVLDTRAQRLPQVDETFYGAQPPMRAMVSFDSIAYLSFESTNEDAGSA